MLLTISTTHRPATDLGYLLHKHPDRVQTFNLSFGSARVFYPQSGEDGCTAARLLDADPMALSRGKHGAPSGPPLQPYVNDWPYVASSFLSVALAQVYKSALICRSDQRQDLADTTIPLVAGLSVLPARGGESFVRQLFEPLSLYEDALARLTMEDRPDPEAADQVADDSEAAVERPLRLNDQRLAVVLEALRASDARSVVDLGCGEGRLLQALLSEPRYDRLAGMDVSYRAVSMASDRLNLDTLPERQRDRLSLFQGSLLYRDARLAGFDAAVLMEVIEHLDPGRLQTFEQELFRHARPASVILTTPNADYNARWSSLPDGRMRHADHRFEWTRAELRAWAGGVAERHGYSVAYQPIGAEDAFLGPPTLMAIFTRA